jgi:hypothetical protein
MNPRPICALTALFLLLSGCAAEVPRQPERLTPATVADGVEQKTVSRDIPVRLSTGYERLIPRGTQWERIGAIAEGAVYKPVSCVFSVEGAHVHEAYLVVNRGKLVGFYLPVEKAFSALESKDITVWGE